MQAQRRRTALRPAMVGALAVALAACAQMPRGPDSTAVPAPRAAAPHPDARAHAIDPVHTRIVISIDHAGFSSAIGTVSGSTGTLYLVPGSWEGAHVAVDIPLGRLDFGDDDWNRAVAAGGLLDTGRHPTAHFRSTRLDALDPRRARIHGELTLRGTTREVVLDAVRNGERRHPLPPFRQTVGFSATTTLSRADFGSTAWGSVIGDTVDVRIELEATR